jgi:GT2 family glycosyltransferase
MTQSNPYQQLVLWVLDSLTDGTIQTSCLQTFPTIINQLFDADLFRRLFPRARFWGTAPLFTNQQMPLQVEGISGACLMTPKYVFEKVGGFNEDYFMYYEDMDYCLKVSKAGCKNYFIPDAVIMHHGGKSSEVSHNSFSCVMMVESARKYFHNWKGQLHAMVFRMSVGAKAILYLILLVMAYILTFSKDRRKSVCNRLYKWASIFRWFLGAERWLGMYR